MEAIKSLQGQAKREGWWRADTRIQIADLVALWFVSTLLISSPTRYRREGEESDYEAAEDETRHCNMLKRVAE